MTITSKDVESVLRYSPETGEFFWRARTAQRVQIGDRAGTDDGHGYIVIPIAGRRYFAHRLAWLVSHGEMPGGDLDHIDGNPSNNRINNLRLASRSENNRNRGAQANNTTGFKGVTRFRGKFMAQIGHEGDHIFLGYFQTAEEAHTAYCEAARKYHREFARVA